MEDCSLHGSQSQDRSRNASASWRRSPRCDVRPGCVRIRLVELRRLRLLLELSRRGTVAAVAEALAYSPSSVSVQLAELEREAGVKLLRRVGRNVQLTPAGWRLAEHAEKAIAADEAIVTELASARRQPARQRAGDVRADPGAVAAAARASSAGGERAGPEASRCSSARPRRRSRSCARARSTSCSASTTTRCRCRATATSDRRDLIREQVLLAVPADDPLAASGGADRARGRRARGVGGGSPRHGPQRGGRDALQRPRRLRARHPPPHRRRADPARARLLGPGRSRCCRR